MSLDDFDWAILVAAGAVFAAYCLWVRSRRRRDILVEIGQRMGSAMGLEVNLAEGREGRRYVALQFLAAALQEDAEDRPVELLLTSQAGSELARMMRVAASPGRTIAVARALERQRRPLA